MSDYLTTAEAAKKLGITIRGVQKMISDKRLVAVPMGQIWLVHQDAIAPAKKLIRKAGRPRKKKSEKIPK